jgi:anthranilate synthase/aminodeoxychorismate synthase-like glutamine amidotransferase
LNFDPVGTADFVPLTAGLGDDTPRPVAKRVVVIDNYDSFTYNLVQYLEELGAECEVLLNDRTTPKAVAERMPRGVVVSPGPGRPDSAGITVPVIRALAGRVPVLGVCLGNQAIGQAFGARVRRASRPVHGRASGIEHSGNGLFTGIPSPFSAGRYHSLVLEEATLPECLEVTARVAEGDIMGVRHRDFSVEGVQFHPESVLTKHGKQLLANWLGAT